jgi:hypothetical protein
MTFLPALCCLLSGWWRCQREVQRQTAHGFALVSAGFPADDAGEDVLVPVVSLGKMMMLVPRNVEPVSSKPVMTRDEAYFLRMFALEMVSKAAEHCF